MRGWNDDYNHTHQELRQSWIDAGMVWFSKAMRPPKDWNPYRQLIEAGHGADLMISPRMESDIDYRYAVDEAFSNVRIARQIKTLRESHDPPLTQKQLAEQVDMKQSRISELEKTDYSMWSISTLRRIARGLGVRFVFRFESWGELLPDIAENFSRKVLCVPSFEQDHVFRKAMTGRTEVRDRIALPGGITVLLHKLQPETSRQPASQRPPHQQIQQQALTVAAGQGSQSVFGAQSNPILSSIRGTAR